MQRYAGGATCAVMTVDRIARTASRTCGFCRTVGDAEGKCKCKCLYCSQCGHNTTLCPRKSGHTSYAQKPPLQAQQQNDTTPAPQPRRRRKQDEDGLTVRQPDEEDRAMVAEGNVGYSPRNPPALGSKNKRGSYSRKRWWRRRNVYAYGSENPLSVEEMLKNLTAEPVPAGRRLRRDFRRFVSCLRRRLQSSPKQLPPRNPVVKPTTKPVITTPAGGATDTELRLLRGMGYTHDDAVLHAVRSTAPNFPAAVDLIGEHMSGRRVTFTFRGTADEIQRVVDTPSFKRSGDGGAAWIGTDPACDCCFEFEDTDLYHAQLILGPIVGGATCDLRREAQPQCGGGNRLLHIVDDGSQHGLFVNRVRVHTAYLWPGDELIFGWQAAARTRHRARYPLAFPAHLRVKLESIRTTALCTREQHVKPTELMMASQSERQSEKARERQLPMMGGSAELYVPATTLTVGPSVHVPRTHDRLALPPLERLPEFFNQKRRGVSNIVAQRELSLGRPLTPAERQGVTWDKAAALPGSGEMQKLFAQAANAGRRFEALESGNPIWSARYTDAERTLAAEQAAAQQRKAEERHARSAVEWREERHADLQAARSLHERADATLVRVFVDRDGNMAAAVEDTTQHGPLYR